MAKGDMIVKVTADAKGYESGMEKARKSLEKFQKQNQSTDAIMKVATNALTKFVSAAALIKGAQETIKRTMEGSQSTADAFHNSMEGAKNAVNTFFTALSTGDFTNFNQGLSQLITKGKEAAAAMDQLGNTIMSYNFLSSQNNAVFQESLLTMRDTTATPEERAAAQRAAQQSLKYAQDLATGKKASLYDALNKNATKKSILTASDFSLEDLTMIGQLDAFANTPDILSQYGLQSKDYYLSQAAEAAAKIAAAKPTYQSVGAPRSDEDIQRANEIMAANAEKKKAYEEYVEQIKQEYKFALEVKALLEDIPDEELRNNIYGLAQEMSAADQSVTQMERSLKMANGELKRGGIAAPTTTVTTTKVSGGGIDWAGLSLMSQSGQQIHNSLNSGAANDIPQFTAQINNLNESIGTLNKQEGGLNDLASAFATLGSAMGGAGGEAMSAAGAILQAVAVAAPAFTTLTATASTAAGAEAVAETPTLAGKIAAAATITATLISMISTLKGVASYAEGGVIPGRNFTDGITARVSSGEMIMNEADQKRLYDSIHSGNLGGGGGQPYITGEMIVMGLNNYGKRTGRGELVFSRG